MTLLHYRIMRAYFIGSIFVAAGLVSACSRDNKSQDGLPPAQEWQQNNSGAMVQMGKPGDLPPPEPPPGMMNPHSGHGANPRGGGDDPHAGLGIDPADPHAGLGIDPHGGSGGANVPPIPGPDPNRKIDPNRFVKGVIKIHEKAKARAKSGMPVFLVVKKVDATGQPVGMPLAVDKLTWNATDLVFELSEQQAMVAGTELTGDVVVTARYDQDGDASSKEPGDITGSTRVKLPADNVTIFLDTIL